MRNPEITKFLLEAIDRCGGEPMPESALVQSAQLAYRHRHPTVSDLEAEIARLESERYLSITTDDLTGQRLVVLTAKGTAALRAR